MNGWIGWIYISSKSKSTVLYCTGWGPNSLAAELDVLCCVVNICLPGLSRSLFSFLSRSILFCSFLFFSC